MRTSFILLIVSVANKRSGGVEETLLLYSATANYCRFGDPRIRYDRARVLAGAALPRRPKTPITDEPTLIAIRRPIGPIN